MAELLCHGSGRMFPHREGADLFVDKDAEQAYVLAIAKAVDALKENGFMQVGDSNAWEKDGVRITIQQVLQEGIEEVVKKHAEVVQSLSPAT